MPISRLPFFSCNCISSKAVPQADEQGAGRENAKTYLSEHPEVMNELEAKIREHYNFEGKVVSEEE